jgi:hypothetical protein
MIQYTSPLLALSGRADRPPSCPVLGVYLPRQPLRVAAVDDPCRTSKFASAVSGYGPEETALCKISPL